MRLKFWTFIPSMILDNTCKNGGNAKPSWSQLTHSSGSLISNGSKLGSTPCKAEHPLQDMELQKRSAKRLKHTGNLLRKNLQLIGVF